MLEEDVMRVFKDIRRRVREKRRIKFIGYMRKVRTLGKLVVEDGSKGKNKDKE